MHNYLCVGGVRHQGRRHRLVDVVCCEEGLQRLAFRSMEPGVSTVGSAQGTSNCMPHMHEHESMMPAQHMQRASSTGKGSLNHFGSSQGSDHASVHM